MNIKILFKKTTLIYIIIVVSLAILFNNSKKVNQATSKKAEGFSDTKSPADIQSSLEILIPIYEEEKTKYKLMFKNGEELFTSIIDLSTITDTSDIETLIQPSELADLAVNLQTDITTLVNKIFSAFEKMEISNVDKYLSENGEYKTLIDKLIDKYSTTYPQLTETIRKEINDLLLEKIDLTLANSGNSANFKIDETKTTTNITKSASNGGFLSGLNRQLEGKVADIDNAEKVIELKRKLTYIRNKIAPSDETNEEELIKIMESFYEPVSTMTSSPESTIPSTPLMTTETTMTGPLQRTPKSFDGFTREELEIIQRNQLANTPKNIDTVLIDPLKAVETVQEDLLGLLETFNNSNNKKKKDVYLNRQFDPTNRGSYLINSPNNDFTTNKIENLSYYSKPIDTYSKRILSPKEKIEKTLANKEYRKIDEQLVKPGSSLAGVEGFKDSIDDKTESDKQSEMLTMFDGFVRYSSDVITGLIKKLTSGTIDMNSMDNNKMQSYGVVIIAVAILLFFISSSS